MLKFIISLLTLIVSTMTLVVSLMNNQNKTIDIPHTKGTGGSEMAMPSESGSDDNNTGEVLDQQGSSLVSRSGLSPFKISANHFLRGRHSGLASKGPISGLKNRN
ncbi:uncharacterized protein Eint_111750 [Encephalitozoon intestinalis ATCC 50506]|uniref:Uncharacterized protein n=1 Tax=Encephalitozoon intestinalis (strain ATCC 50506) TaxID=876142 RepID=E0SA52_ENCIT|nr:uncharacterized protein Eint_111750 [Encephalitozoon intestinalis ATCC 50506]ADM12674.1 hypothetical protein Eint_111750 [Encephalitozoon intestinalis ATCC 50506]UTX46535.1 hypothetical protein GPK93_11g21470 [Encephalitozoon intestinalis]